MFLSCEMKWKINVESEAERENVQPISLLPPPAPHPQDERRREHVFPSWIPSSSLSFPHSSAAGLGFCLLLLRSNHLSTAGKKKTRSAPGPGGLSPGGCVCRGHSWGGLPYPEAHAAILPVGTWPVRTKAWPFLIHEQSQAALISSPSLPISQPQLSAALKASCSHASLTAPAYPVHFFPVLASILGCPNASPQPKRSSVSSNAFLREPLCISLSRLYPETPGPAFSSHVAWETLCAGSDLAAGPHSVRFRVVSLRSSSRLPAASLPPLTKRRHYPRQLFSLHFLFSLHGGQFKAQ